MTLPRNEVCDGHVAELGAFGALVRTLSAEDWAAPSRCAGWTVADVVAHVVGTEADIAAGRLDGLGSPEVTEREVAERRGRTPGELADELDGAVKIVHDLFLALDDATWAAPAGGSLGITVGRGVERLWFDAYVHNDDIRAATGRPSERGPGLRTAIVHVAEILGERGWGPATLAFDGIEPVEIGGGGRLVEGDALAFLLAATGRTDPATIGLDASVNIYG